MHRFYDWIDCYCVLWRQSQIENEIKCIYSRVPRHDIQCKLSMHRICRMILSLERYGLAENTIQKRTHENRERIRHTLCAASQNEAINNGLRATAFVSSLALWFGN